MNRGLPLGLLMAVLTLGWVGTVPQASAATSSCAGVWVVVDYGSEGGTSTKCATSYSTGRAALTSAGFGPELDNGMIIRIGGKPDNPDINKAYWSYWTATLTSDGTYTGWKYSTLGATSSHPVKGNAEGWRYQSLSDGKVPPAAAPPKGEATPKPTPTPTKTKTAKPTPTAKPSVTAKPTATAKPTTTAKPTASARPTATTATRTASATPTPTMTPTDSPDATTAGATSVDDGPPPTGNGSPVGAIVAGSAVVVAGAGLGGWWLLKGRKR